MQVLFKPVGNIHTLLYNIFFDIMWSCCDSPNFLPWNFTRNYRKITISIPDLCNLITFLIIPLLNYKETALYVIIKKRKQHFKIFQTLITLRGHRTAKIYLYY